MVVSLLSVVIVDADVVAALIAMLLMTVVVEDGNESACDEKMNMVAAKHGNTASSTIGPWSEAAPPELCVGIYSMRFA